MIRLTDTLLIDLVLRLTNPSTLFDFAHCSHTWLFHDSLLEMMTPRSLSALVTTRGTPFVVHVGHKVVSQGNSLCLALRFVEHQAS